MSANGQLFELPMAAIYYLSKAGDRKGFTHHSAHVYDEDGDLIVAVEAHLRKRRGVKRAIIETARTAWMLRNFRPLGDEYTAGEFHVYYLYEM